MARIIRFPVEKTKSATETVTTLEGTSAQIIIFPGIRFEYHGVSFAVAK